MVCLFMGLVLVGCKQSTSIDTSIIHNPNSASGYDQSEKMPVISFDKELHDFGRIDADENIAYSFKFTNTGNADLVISQCDATCSCTVSEYPHERIAPGQSGYITVSFNSSGKRGQQYQEVTVITNAQPSRTTLKIRAIVN